VIQATAKQFEHRCHPRWLSVRKVPWRSIPTIGASALIMDPGRMVFKMTPFIALLRPLRRTRRRRYIVRGSRSASGPTGPVVTQALHAIAEAPHPP
jgi:hypothetical protein